MAVLCSILLITVLLPIITADCQKCFSGFTSIGGSCYAPIIVKANRGDAIKECQKLHPDATLATVRSAENNAALHDLAVNKIRDQCSSFSNEPWKNAMWLGYWDDAADAKNTNPWANEIKSDYRNWVSGQPNDDTGEEKGVAMVIHPNIPNNPDGLWFDLHSSNSVICGAMCEVLKCDDRGSTSSSSPPSNGCFTHVKAQVADTCAGIFGFTDVGGSCYAPIYVDGTQADAKAQCKKLHPDADLASIRCEAENEGVWKLAQKPLRDRCANHNSFQYLNQLIIGKSVGAWSDGSNTSYSNWNVGEPNGGAAQPVSTMFITNEGTQFPHAKWNDEGDGKFCGAMCEVFVGTSGSSCGLKPCTGLTSAATVSTTTSKPPHCALSGYKLVGNKWCLSWYSRQYYAQGRAACQGDGNDVLSIHSAEENALLQGYLDVDVMMGAYYDGSRWAWYDGTPFDYTNWAPGEPRTSPWMLFSKATGKWTTFSGNPYTSYYAICHGKPVN